MRTFISEADL